MFRSVQGVFAWLMVWRVVSVSKGLVTRIQGAVSYAAR